MASIPELILKDYDSDLSNYDSSDDELEDDLMPPLMKQDGGSDDEESDDELLVSMSELVLNDYDSDLSDEASSDDESDDESDDDSMLGLLKRYEAFYAASSTRKKTQDTMSAEILVAIPIGTGGKKFKTYLGLIDSGASGSLANAKLVPRQRKQQSPLRGKLKLVASR